MMVNPLNCIPFWIPTQCPLQTKSVLFRHEIEHDPWQLLSDSREVRSENALMKS